MALPYRQVKDLYDILHAAGATQSSLADWAQQMDTNTESDLYSAGLTDNWVKRASVAVDRGLEWTGLPELGSKFGRAVSEPFGMGDVGADIGHSLPRMTANFLPIIAAGAASGGTALPAILGALGTGALSGAETYTQTDSVGAGLLSGAINATVPGITGKAEQGVLAFLRNRGLKAGIAESALPRLEAGSIAGRWLDAQTPINIKAVSQLFPRTTGQSVASNIGGQLGAAAYMEAGGFGQDALSGQPLHNPLSSENVLANVLGQLPFSFLHLGGKALGFGPKFTGVDEQGNTFTRPFTANDSADQFRTAISRTESALDRKQAVEGQKRSVGIDSIPQAESPIFTEEQQKRHDTIMSELLGKEAQLKADPTPENLTELAKVTEQQDNVIRSAASQGAKGLGTTSSPKGYTPIKGETTFYSPDRGFRVVQVLDPQGATYADGSPIQPGDKVGFSTGKYESPINRDATNQDVILPPKQFFSKLTDNTAWSERKATPNQPELPIQAVQLDLHQHLERTRALESLEKELAVSQTLADKTEILGRVNDLREQLGFERVDLPKAVADGIKSGAKTETASIQAIIEHTKRVQEIDLKGTEKLHARLQAEAEFQAELRQNASPGSEEAGVLDYYDSLAKDSSGRREQVILEDNGVSPFWKHAIALASRGELTPQRMRNFVETTADKGKGLKGRDQKAKVEASIFHVPNDPAVLQLLGDTVREVTSDIAQTSVGKVVRNIFRNKTRDVLTGASKELDTKLPTVDEVAEAAVDSGMFEDIADPEAVQFALDFHDPQTRIGSEVERVMHKINKSFSHPPELGPISNAPGRIEIPVREVTVDELPDAQKASETKWYHGTGANDITLDSISSSFTKHESLFGSGIYLTDSPEVANSYGNKRGKGSGSIYELSVSPRNVLNFEKPLPKEAIDAIKSATYEDIRPDIDWYLEKYPNASGADLWDHLTETVTNHSHDNMWSSTEYLEMFQGIESNLRQAGFDAITHIGGLRVGPGDRQHKVLILLDPQNEFADVNSTVPKTVNSVKAVTPIELGLISNAPGRIEEKPFTPSPEQKSVHDILSSNGESMVNHLLTSEYGEYRALAKDLLASFPEALRATQGEVRPGFGTAATGARVDKMGSAMYFHPSVLDMAPGVRDTIMVHELAHSLSLNLLDKGLSPELTLKLESIRKRAIDALPKKLRDQFTKANAEDWITRSQQSGDVDMWDTLAPKSEGFTESDRQILYALLNNKELISQSWSSDSFKNYLKKLPGKVNGLQSFINWTKELFGFGDKYNNMLRELIETSHSLMSHGEFLTSAENYGRAWFDMRGEKKAYGQAQTNRALELLESGRFGITEGEIAGTLSSSQGRANEELNRARTRVDKVFQDPEDINHQGARDSLAEWGHEESTKGIDDLVISALDEGHDLNDALESMPLPMAKYIYEKLKDQRDVIEFLQSATASGNKGVVNITNPELVRKPLFEVRKRIEKMLEVEAKELESAQSFLKLSAVDPFGFLKSQMAEYANAPGKIEEKAGDGKVPVDRAFISRFLEPMGQMALRFPEAAEIISKGFQLVTNGRLLGNQSLKVFGSDLRSEHLDVTDKASVNHMKKMMGDPHLRKGVYEWIGENQFRNRDAVTMLDESDPAIAKLKQRYTNEQWEVVRDFVTKQGLSRQKFNTDKLAFLQQIASVRGAGIISESGLKTGENIALADAMLKAVMSMKDPLGAEGAKAQFDNIRSKLKDPEDFISLLEFARGEAEKLGTIKDVLDKNPYWAPAQRMEQWLVSGTKNGKAWKQSYSSKKEAEIEVKNHGVKQFTIEDQFKGKEDEPFELPGLSPQMLERMREIEENQIKILVKKNVLDAEGLEEYRRSSVIGQVAREADAGTGTSGLNPPPRQLGHGAEDLPWLRNHIVGIQREARYLARQLLRAQKSTYLKHPELRGDEQLRSDLSTHFDNILHPDPQLAQKMTRFASTWFMGFNVASTLVNATQPFLTHVSEMTAITGRPLESYKRVTRALKEAIAGSYGKHSWATKEHEQFMNEMAEAGERDMSMYDDQAQDHEAVATGLLRAIDKQKPQTLGQKLSSAAGVYSTVAMMPFKAVEQINASAALLASFDYYREKGFSYEEAKEKASTFNRGVNFSGGRGQRPVLAFAGRGTYPRGSAMLGTALQSYVLGTTSQIGRYLQSGFFRPKGLTPYEVFSARKAAAQMLGTQLAAAGLLGLPFVSGAIALLDKLFPDLELNKHIREGMSTFLSSDTENGSPLGDIAMTGVPSMLGWDLQSRLSMGNTLPGVSEVNGFQPENLVGPVANIVKNFVGGVQGWSKGDPGSTGKFLPPAVRKLIEAGKSSLSDGGEIRDFQGRPLENPTGGEKIGQAIGFQPKRLSDQNAASRILKQTTDVENQRQREEVGKMAQEVMKGNYGTVRQAILNRLQTDKTYNAEDAVRAIASNVEEQSFPRDLRREGSLSGSQSRSGLLSSYSNLSSSNSPTEVARLQLRQEVERKLGLTRKLDGQLKLAQLMDQLKQAKPGLTRSQLRVAAQQLLRRSQPSTLQMSQE